MILPMRFAPSYDVQAFSRQTVEATAVVLNGTDGLNISPALTLAAAGSVKTQPIYVAGYNLFNVKLKGGGTDANIGVIIVELDPTDNATELFEHGMGSTVDPFAIGVVEKILHGMHTIKLKFYNTSAVNTAVIDTIYGLRLATI